MLPSNSNTIFNVAIRRKSLPTPELGGMEGMERGREGTEREGKEIPPKVKVSRISTV